jgi:acetoin utilization protein AcuC
VAGGRWLATGGGGYALVDVVPRAWTHLLAELTGDPIDPHTDTAPGWQAHVRALGASPPTRMTDGADAAYEPWQGPVAGDRLDADVQATRDAVFACHGLDPVA